MNQSRYSTLILAMALIIIGMRGVCMAQFSRHVSFERSDTQARNQLATSANKLNAFQQFEGGVRNPVAEQGGVGFTFRVKRQVYVSPANLYIGIQSFAGRKRNPFVVGLAQIILEEFRKTRELLC